LIVMPRLGDIFLCIWMMITCSVIIYLWRLTSQVAILTTSLNTIHEEIQQVTLQAESNMEVLKADATGFRNITKMQNIDTEKRLQDMEDFEKRAGDTLALYESTAERRSECLNFNKDFEFIEFVGQPEQTDKLDRIVVDRYFRRPRRNCGVFLDIGANDGVTFDNTLVLESYYGWTGICVEPNPDSFQKLAKNRPKCINIHGGISENRDRLEFIKVTGYAEMLSGWKGDMTQDQFNRIDSEIQQHGGTKEIIFVESYSLNSLLMKHNIKDIDFISLDTEGSELKILRSIDFSTIRIGVICIEIDTSLTKEKYNAIQEFMLEHGYTLDLKLGFNQIWIAK